MLVPLLLAAVVGVVRGGPVDDYIRASLSTGAPLNDYIRHYQPVHYDRALLQRQHSRTRRHARPSPDVRLRLQAGDREFRLRLRPDRSVFSPDVVFESDSGPLDFDTRAVYTGFLEDDEGTVVHGIISSDGAFDGTVSTASDRYFIEPSSRYLPGPQPFHSLVYRLSDVTRPRHSGAGCWSQRLADRNTTGDDVIATSHAQEVVDEWLGHSQLYENLGDNVTSRERIVNSDDVSSVGDNVGGRRSRREVVNSKKTTCTMYLQADHLFYEQFGSEEACIDAMIRHVQQANEIYNSVDFDGDGTQDNIGFMIKRVRVHKPSAANDVEYRYDGNFGVEKYLEIFSEENYDSFCLAYMFTYRDFAGGTLGLAWTGDLNQAGGVCEKNGFYRGSKKSLNTGIISILNYGKRVPPAVSHVTFAHEIGHNFGSQHDPDNNNECSPGGESGNYIMFARATSGDKRNNNRFSPCSLRSINPVLRVKARSKRGCFVEPQAAICGNGVVEEGEECDCGWEEDCKERCCIPMSVTPRPGNTPCRLTPGSECSPSQGPCCNTTCVLGYGQKCRGDNGCRAVSRCNGRSPHCPPSIRKPDRTICAQQNVCFKGECSGSICLAYGLESCQCDPGPEANLTKACELCCKRPGSGQPCISSFEWNTPPLVIPSQYSRPGTPCKQYRGYCDVFQQCREVDPNGPLATLKDLLLSDKSLSVVKEFMDQYWYMIVLGMVIIILSLIAVIRIFGKSPPVRSRRRHRHRGQKRARKSEAPAAPLPDVAANAAATADASAEEPTKGATAAADTDPTPTESSERGRQPLKRRVDDVKRAAAKARRAASHMALSSRASVASGVARVMETGRRGAKRHRSRTAAPDAHKRRRKEGERRDKSRGGHRRARDKTASKENIKVISYTNIPAEVVAEKGGSKEAQASGAAAKGSEAAAQDADKRKSLPAELARRKGTPSDADKRRSLPKIPGSPEKQPRLDSPSKQRRSAAESEARPRSPDRAGRRHARDGDKSRSRQRGTDQSRLGRSSSQRHRSSKREDKKKRSRSISPTKRQTSKPAAKAAAVAEDKPKKRFGLHMSTDNVISDWLGRNAKKQTRANKAAERSRKKPIVPTAPMHPNDQVLQWLQRASHEPAADDDITDGMVSPQPTRRTSQSSLTSGSLPRVSAAGRAAGRSRGSSLSSNRPGQARDTASSAGASERPSPYRGTEVTNLSGDSRPSYRRSRSHGAAATPPGSDRLALRPASDSEPVYDLPRGASPERIYDLPKGATPERSIPEEAAEHPPSTSRQVSAPPVPHHSRSPDRQLSAPVLQGAPPGQRTATGDHQPPVRPPSPPRHLPLTERPVSQRPPSPLRHPPPFDRQMSVPAGQGRTCRAGSPVPLRHPSGTDRQMSVPAGRPRRPGSPPRPLSLSAAADPRRAGSLAARPLPEPPLLPPPSLPSPEPSSTASEGGDLAL